MIQQTWTACLEDGNGCSKVSSPVAAPVQLHGALHQVTITTPTITDLIHFTNTSGFAIQFSLTASCGVTGVHRAGGDELTARLRAATYRRHARHTCTAGLVGSFEDTNCGVQGTAPVVI